MTVPWRNAGVMMPFSEYDQNMLPVQPKIRKFNSVRVA